MNKTDMSLPSQSLRLSQHSSSLYCLNYQFLAINSNKKHSSLFLNFRSDHSPKHLCGSSLFYRRLFTFRNWKYHKIQDYTSPLLKVLLPLHHWELTKFLSEFQPSARLIHLFESSRHNHIIISHNSFSEQLNFPFPYSLTGIHSKTKN